MFSEQFFDLLLNFGDNWKVETFKAHLKGIVNAMVSTFTNAMDERLNGKNTGSKSFWKRIQKIRKLQKCNSIFSWRIIPLPIKIKVEP